MDTDPSTMFNLLHGDAITPAGPSRTHLDRVDIATLLQAWLDATPRWRWIVRGRLERRLDEVEAREAERAAASRECVLIFARSRDQARRYTKTWLQERPGRRHGNATFVDSTAYLIGRREDYAVSLPGFYRNRDVLRAYDMARAAGTEIRAVEE